MNNLCTDFTTSIASLTFAADASSTFALNTPMLPLTALSSCQPGWIDLVQPICPTLDVKYVLDRCVHAPTPKIKQDTIALIMKVMESGSVVSNYITFVLAYLKDFKINIQRAKRARKITNSMS